MASEQSIEVPSDERLVELVKHKGRDAINCLNQWHGNLWSLYHGDSCEVMRGLPDNSIDLCIHSPPFQSLFIYSDSEADMGNSQGEAEFFEHYNYAIAELLRVTVPGRLCIVHCKDLPKYQNREGTAGLIDFPGQIIRAFEETDPLPDGCWWSYHSRVTIWKCPVTERERTNNNGLLHKTVLRDRSQLRQGMADYLLCFRKAPVGTLMSNKPVRKTAMRPVMDASGQVEEREFPVGYEYYVGSVHPRENDVHPSPYARKNNSGDAYQGYSIDVWRRYAEPVWWDVDQTDVLNYRQARGERDERHICLARDSLVLTKTGHKPIQDVATGDLVLTHMGRWRPVIAKQCTGVNDVVKVRAQGVHDLMLTPTHKVWARNPGGLSHPKKSAIQASPDWVESQSLEGMYVNMKLPPVEPAAESDDELRRWWIVGRWLADGHIDQRDVAHISRGREKAESFLQVAGSIAGNPQHRTALQFPLKDPGRKIRDILSRCGRLAHGKRLPPEAFTLPQVHTRALLDGYLSGDGHFNQQRNRWYATSVSRELLLGLQFIVLRTTGSVASLHAGRGPGTTVIEGRTVNTRQEWVLSWGSVNYSFSFVADDGAWKKVKSVEQAGTAETWNLRVAEDESYTAEGCVVKNCPLQCDLIRRAVHIWSNPGDIVLSPFAGIGSEGVGAIQEGRRFVGVELKDEYCRQAVKNLKAAEAEAAARRLFV